jgi:hypothetical protein
VTDTHATVPITAGLMMRILKDIGETYRAGWPELAPFMERCRRAFENSWFFRAGMMQEVYKRSLDILSLCYTAETTEDLEYKHICQFESQ